MGKRDIQFRAYNKVLREIFPNVQNHIGNDVWAFGRMLNDNDFIIMQYTGVRDKNNIQIYEGDILELPIGDINNKYRYVVSFEDGSFVAYHTKLKDGYGHPQRWGLISQFNIKDLDVVIVGNIYENPELCDGKN